MREISRNRKKEIWARAASKDVRIGTAAIPEVRDWSSAIQGRFYRLMNKQVTVRFNSQSHDNVITLDREIADSPTRKSSAEALDQGKEIGQLSGFRFFVRALENILSRIAVLFSGKTKRDS